MKPRTVPNPYMRISPIALVLLLAAESGSQTLPLPPRTTDALSNQDFLQQIISQPPGEREKAAVREVFSGNVPDFMRRLCQVTVTNVLEGKTNSATFFVTPDYLAVGFEPDYFRIPLTPMAAQFVADRLDCALPTRKMVDAIYAAADVKLVPSPIPPSPAMTHVTTFDKHNSTVQSQLTTLSQRPPPGALVAGHKKDVVITSRLATNAGKVAIYGWHQTNGQPIQPPTRSCIDWPNSPYKPICSSQYATAATRAAATPSGRLSPMLM